MGEMAKLKVFAEFDRRRCREAATDELPRFSMMRMAFG